MNCFFSKFICAILSLCLILNEANLNVAQEDRDCGETTLQNELRGDILDLRADLLWLKQQLQKIEAEQPSCAAELLVNGPRFKVPDSGFTESTPHPSITYKPQRARLDTQFISGNPVFAGSWASGKNDPNQYIQVDLGMVYVVRGVITQGRSDADQWATSYKVQHSITGSTFYDYSGKGNTPIVFSGNTDGNSKVKHEFMVPFKAKYIRINPQTWHGHISMRFDILGCPNSDLNTSLDSLEGEKLEQRFGRI